MRKLMALGFVLSSLALAPGQSVLLTFVGNSPGDRFGRSVASAGDINGDGVPDLIVGAPHTDVNGILSGSARVFSGVDGSVLFTFNASFPNERFGFSVDGAGDVDADGVPDLIVGAPNSNQAGPGSGSARVFSGLDGSLLFAFTGTAYGQQFGHSVAGSGDLDGDGFPELLVGAPRNLSGLPGQVHVFSGFDGSTLFTLLGSAANDVFGTAVASAGDVNGDGIPDLIVGARLADPNGTDSGSAHVFSGLDASPIRRFDGDSQADEFGGSVAGAGDVNRDGFADLIVGARLNDMGGTDSGSARVFSGADGATLFTFSGNSAGDQFGGSVAGGGDVNGDGFDDLVIGAEYDDGNGVDAGLAQVFSGLDGSQLYSISGAAAYERFGRSVAGAGDVNGDGAADLIVGSIANNVPLNGGSTPGIARVFAGQREFGLAGPPAAFVGSSLSYTLRARIPQPGGMFVFDLSLSGATPGIALSSPLNGPIPLNPPLLNLTLGPLFPGLFVGFAGPLDASGEAGVVFNVPNLPSLSGRTLSAAGVSLDPLAPLGLGFVSNGISTTLGPPPSVSPMRGPLSGGAPVTVNGSGFAAGTTVTTGGNPLTNISVLDSQTLTGVTPAGSLGPADLTVTLPSGPSVTVPGGYTYIPDLSLGAATPLSALPGTPIAISGDGFLAGLALDVGGVAQTPLTVTQTLVTFAMPAGVACDGLLTVFNPSNQTDSIPFNPRPVISQVYGQQGPAGGGGQITIVGAGFFPGTTVTVGGNPATITAQQEPYMVATVPAGNPGSAIITVTSPTGCTALCIAPGGCNYVYQ